MDTTPGHAVYRLGDIEVTVRQVSATRWLRTVSIAGEQVFAGTAPVFSDGPAGAAASALMTLIFQLASEAPMNEAVQWRAVHRAEDLRAMRTALARDAADLLVDGDDRAQ